jgi:hypothetical protein
MNLSTLLRLGGISLGLTLAMLPQQYAGAQASTPAATVSAAPDEARAIAKDAYIYAYPMLFNYKTLYEQAEDPGSKSYVGGFGKFRNYSHPYGPENKDIVTPNNDTPYSWAWLDLRREPWVLTVPAVKNDRYYVFQWIDLFTYNFAYVGSRTTGNGAGHYLFAGPNWHGDTPKGIDKVFRSETDIILTLGRTALSGPSDVKDVEAIQKQYRLTPLSAFEHSSAPPPVAKVAFPKWDEAKATSIDFIAYLNFLLQFTQPTAPSETELMQRFAKIGIAPGAAFGEAHHQFLRPVRQPPGSERRLHETGSRRRDGDLRQHQGRSGVRRHANQRGPRATDGLATVRHPLRQERPAAREVLLVDDDVRPAGPSSGGESDPSLLDRRPHQGYQVRRRRLARYLRSAQLTWRRQGIQLAARSGRRLRRDRAHLRPGRFGLQRQLDLPGAAKAMTPNGRVGARHE